MNTKAAALPASGKTATWRLFRLVCAALAAVILLAQVPALVHVFGLPNVNGYGGIDYGLYMDTTRRWMAGGPFYEAYQLAGPYRIEFGDVLYPPVALWLFVPFTFLPAALWWAVPLAVSAAVLLWLRPGPLAWPLMALCLWEPVQIHIISGNPDIWALMFLSLGMRWPWVAVFAMLKPSLGPFGLWGIRHRSWWVALAVFAAMSAVFLPMWFDWLTAVLNSRGGGLLYSWQEAPLMLIPIIAWLCRPGGRYDIEGRA